MLSEVRVLNRRPTVWWYICNVMNPHTEVKGHLWKAEKICRVGTVLFSFLFITICGPFCSSQRSVKQQCGKETDNIEEEIWALGNILFGALIFPANHAVGLNIFPAQLHIPVIDEGINILLSPAFYLCLTAPYGHICKWCCDVGITCDYKSPWAHLPWMGS